MSIKNIIMGVCNKKRLDIKGKKFFSCVIAQMVALLARIYYRRAKVGQDGIIRLVNWGLDLCLALGWNKGFRTYMGRWAEVQSARGPSLSMRTRVIKQAEEDDKEVYGNGIWNTVFDLWEYREIPGRN